MSEETYSFDMARVRLEEIAAQVRKKDMSLEKSLDLLEEGVRLANLCTEQIDQTQWRSVLDEAPVAPGLEAAAEESAETEEEVEAAPDPAQGTLCEEDAAEGAGSLEADLDVPAEDSHGAAEEPPAEDPDVEA